MSGIVLLSCVGWTDNYSKLLNWIWFNNQYKDIIPVKVQSQWTTQNTERETRNVNYFVHLLGSHWLHHRVSTGFAGWVDNATHESYHRKIWIDCPDKNEDQFLHHDNFSLSLRIYALLIKWTKDHAFRWPPPIAIGVIGVQYQLYVV